MNCTSLPLRFSSAALLLVAFSLLVSQARAQTGAALLVKPWPDKGEVFDGTADAYLYSAGHTNTGNSFQLFDYDSVGRFRIIPGNEISPRIGYDITFLDNHSHMAGLPDQLSDESVAFGTGVAKFDPWVIGVTLGVGYAGSSVFDVGSAWYGKADVIVARQINETDFLGVVMDYDGHRTYLPDTPLPGIGYSHRFDKRLQVVLGAPFNSVSWKPIEPLDLELEYDLLQDLKASVGYEVIRHWTLFARYDFIRDAFHIDGLPKDHRVLFYDQRMEAGVRFSPNDHLSFKVGAGYGWDGAYSSGWDFRKSVDIAHFSDEPYLHVAVDFAF